MAATGNNQYQSFSRLVAEMRDEVFNLNRDNSSKIEPTIKKCSATISIMKGALKDATSVSAKQHITNCLGLMTGFRTMVKSLRTVYGGEYKPTNPNKANYTSSRVKWQDLESAFASRIHTGAVTNLNHKNSGDFLQDAGDVFNRRIRSILKKNTAIKVNAAFCGEFIISKAGKDIFEFKYFKTKNTPIYSDTAIKKWYNEHIVDPILKELEEFQEKDSGWALSKIINVTFNINRFNPQLGSSYIELPRSVKLKRACVNVRNNDNACFAWAVTSALFQSDKHTEQMTSYPHYSHVLKLKNISLPMTIKQIPCFEQQNEISINVYIMEKSSKTAFTVVPTYLTKNKQHKHINLLLIQDAYDDEDDGNNDNIRYHYVWIKNLSRLISAQLSKHDGKKYFCDRCLHYFITEEKLKKHEEDCSKMNECKVRLPKREYSNLHFKDYKNKERAPFVVYADLECLLAPGKENKLQEHIPYSAGYYVKCAYDDSLSFYKSHRGEDCQKWFSQEMKQFAEDVETVFLCPLPMEALTPAQEFDFHCASHCHICEQPFSAEDIKVRDHNHFTSKYRGPSHRDCNINYRDGYTIPVVFHNLSGYDSHFIIKNVAKDFEGRIELLPINKERYISFTKHIDANLVKFRFIDSFRFLASGLESLASHLSDFPNLKSQFRNLSDITFKLLTRKGVFPYDYIDSFSKLDETRLPEKSKFYNTLTDSDITDEDYAHAKVVWNSFNCQNLGEYSDLYLKTDVLLLTDIFEQFRSSCMKTYTLDPVLSYTLPGYTWNCMLKFTNINLELLTDIDMLMFIERGIRGGLSQCSKRHATANNKYLPNYQPNKPSKFLIYNDINNQYGWAMSQHLPYGGFEWVTDVENFNFNVPDDNPEGYILEVDLEYPDNIHDSHSDLPFCPEHRSPPNSKETKLMATLCNKRRYVIHYRYLQQAIENGLSLTKIHRVLKFKQSAWLKSYIDLNTKLRTAATNEFDKNLFKLMNNAVFGKTMENIRKHSIIKLVTKWEGRYGAEALIARPNFKSSTIFDDNLVAIELNKTEIYFNKPIYVGMCILDISKLKIYDFHYSYMRGRFGDNARICYTDTDSLIYEVECDDLYDVIRCDALEYFDTSDYPENNIYNIPRVNKKVLGMMKDENSGNLMTEFVGLRSKMYSCKVENCNTVKKAKGVKKHVVKNKIEFNDYIMCLEENKETFVEQKLFQTDKHQVATISQTKTALSPHDNKRYIMPGTHDTLPWGHWRIIET